MKYVEFLATIYSNIASKPLMLYVTVYLKVASYFFYYSTRVYVNAMQPQNWQTFDTDSASSGHIKRSNRFVMLI